MSFFKKHNDWEGLGMWKAITAISFQVGFFGLVFSEMVVAH